MTRVSVDDFFRPDGLIASVKPGFSPRVGQDTLANLIYSAIAEECNSCVMAEGPTGFGKSISLLVPAIVAVLTGKARRVVVSTETIALQDQYVSIDLPLLQKAVQSLGLNFTFAAAKGRSNFPCLNKLEFDEKTNDYKRLTPLTQWLGTQHVGVHSGDVSSVPEDVLPRVSDWQEVAADDDCERRGCPFYGNGVLRGGTTHCFVYEARKNFLQAQIVVTNHTMLLLDRQHVTEGNPKGPLLDEFDLLIVDEAHTLPEKAQGTWGHEIGPRTISGAMRSTDKMLRRAGIDAFDDGYHERWQKMEDAIFAPFDRHMTENLSFDKIAGKEAKMPLEAQTITRSYAATQIALDEMKAQFRKISAAAKQGNPATAEDVAETVKERLGRIYLALQAVFSGDASDKGEEEEMEGNWLSFTEVGESKRFGKHVKLKVKPIEVGPLMRVKLFETIRTVVIASATLRVKGSFFFAKKEMGVPKTVKEFTGKTPFDFSTSVKGYFPKDLPWAPNRGDFFADGRFDGRGYDDALAKYNDAMAERIVKLIEAHGGGALVLFTNLRDMRAMYDIVRDRVGFECMIQGEASKQSLVRNMKSDEHSCLFATKSFFTGVDIPGNALRLLIMTKAPFKIQGDPMYQARLDKLKSRGGNAFDELSMPLMLMDFLQGFGRLIRSVDDRGTFAFLDSKANSKGYGQTIQASLPKIGKYSLPGVKSKYADEGDED